jgi:hypothetical protein
VKEASFGRPFLLQIKKTLTLALPKRRTAQRERELISMLFRT